MKCHSEYPIEFFPKHYGGKRVNHHLAICFGCRQTKKDKAKKENRKEREV